MVSVKEVLKETIAQIIALKEAGHQTKEISELVGVAKSTGRKYLARFKADNSGDTNPETDVWLS